MPKHALNIQQASWQPGQFPQEIASWAPSSTDTSTVSTIHGTGSRTMLNGYAAKAVVEYVKGQNSSIALVNTGNGMTYSSEMPLDDKTLLIATVNRPSAQTNTLNLRASLVTTSADGASNAVFTPIPPLRPDSVVDLSPVYICVLAHLLAASVDARNDLNVIADAFSANAAFEAAEVEFRRLNDAMTSCLDSNFFSMTILEVTIETVSLTSNVGSEQSDSFDLFDGKSLTVEAADNPPVSESPEKPARGEVEPQNGPLPGAVQANAEEQPHEKYVYDDNEDGALF